MWWLGLAVAVGYTVLGVTMIIRREWAASSTARFHQRIARVTPRLYPGRIGRLPTREEHVKVLIVPMAVFLIVVGIAFGIVIATKT